MLQQVYTQLARLSICHPISYCRNSTAQILITQKIPVKASVRKLPCASNKLCGKPHGFRTLAKALRDCETLVREGKRDTRTAPILLRRLRKIGTVPGGCETGSNARMLFCAARKRLTP